MIIFCLSSILHDINTAPCLGFTVFTYHLMSVPLILKNQTNNDNDTDSINDKVMVSEANSKWTCNITINRTIIFCFKTKLYNDGRLVDLFNGVSQGMSILR